MNWLRNYFPVLFSPTFWGYTFTALFAYFGAKEVFDVETLEIIRNWLAGVTTVNVIWKGAKKVGGE